MARKVISIDDKIKQAEAAVAVAKKKYDAALDELERLVTKRKQLEDKKVLEAYHASTKTADEIIAFLNSSKE
ncbi:MAG: ErpK protein [Lachnospiraceae bacterium]|nr:ErpK protein [Lachnospiraceae bacterium]